MSTSFLNTFRSFFGLPKVGEDHRSEFRNPIWGSDDDVDDDDELYHRSGGPRGDVIMSMYSNPMEFNNMITRQMQDVFKTFNSIFGNMQSILEDDYINFDNFGLTTDITPDAACEGNIRDHYLKPGYKILKKNYEGDGDLDGKISADDITVLLKRKDLAEQNQPSEKRGPTTCGAIFQTVITKTVTKADGTVETRRVVKDNLGHVEETVTTTQIDLKSSADDYLADSCLHEKFIKDFPSLWKIF